MELGTNKPSYLLTQMHAIGHDLVTEDYLRNLWLRRLPDPMRTVLAISTEPLNDLARKADELLSLTGKAVADYHISSLYQLFGKTLLKALDLVDKEEIEYITVGSRRSYFIVRRSKTTYYVYSTVLFCSCPHFQFNVLKKKKNLMCKHIIACRIAFATNKCRFHSSPEYMSPDVLKTVGDTV